MAGPLHGVKVLDLSSYMAGPYAAGLLADLGAEVLKVEPPSGDMQRRFPSTAPGTSRSFLGVNRGKSSIVVDLKQDEGKKVLRRLVRSADVLVENFRPGVMERLGVGYDQLKVENPSLVYFSITGYGRDGPLKDNPGFDTVLQTFTGMASFQGAATGLDPHIISGNAVDYYAATVSAIGILGALYHRARTGEGQFVETSLLATALTMQAGRFVWVDGEPRDVNRETVLGKISAIHPTKEGFLFLSAHTEVFWDALCDILGISDLARNERYDTMRKRTEHGLELVQRIHAALKDKTALEWEQLLRGKVPSSAVRNIEDMFDNPQVLGQGLVGHLSSTDGTSYRALHSPVKYHGTPNPTLKGAPALGEHTDQILRDHGLADADIQQLRALGAVA